MSYMKPRGFLPRFFTPICVLAVAALVLADPFSGLLKRKTIDETAITGNFTVQDVVYTDPAGSFYYDAREMRNADFEVSISETAFECTDCGSLGISVEKADYEQWNEAFEVSERKTYAMMRFDGSGGYNNTNSVDVSIYTTRLALKIMDSNGFWTGYAVYRMIDADQNPHIFLAKFEPDGTADAKHAAVFFELES